MSAPTSRPANIAHSGRGPLAVLRRAKNIKNANELKRSALLEDAERLETWAAYLVLGAIVLEAVVWASPLPPFWFKFGNFLADAAVAIGVYGEMRFGHVVGDILKIRLAEATERAANAEKETEKLRAATAWRSLTEGQHKGLALALRKSGSGASVRFSVLMNDQESLNFAQLISIPFRAAGWTVGYRFEAYTHGIMTGILLPEPNNSWLEEMKAVSARVKDAFVSAEIDFVNGWPLNPYMYTDDNAPLGAPIACVYVGPKPAPAI